eukprot:TRINITY_DN15563_c0_g1_i1.p1 TRINITY_DN15563_c0_g1~~TRINITY_DN15563_c0_g1_i1.p1  ORF type:complete len:300 (-),score=79.70 TRINITY_DN15563_c0_g1_i1:162-932(-)
MSAGAKSRTVALTREAGNNGKLEALLAAKGIDCVEVPCIAFTDGPDSAQLPQHLASGAYDYVIVTSPESAKVFLQAWDAAERPNVSVACVGTATGDALRARGLEPAFTPSRAYGEDLAAEIPLPPSAAAGEGGAPRVLYPASARAPGTVQEGLEARGFHVVRLNTYDTGAAAWSDADLSNAAHAAVAAFGSPSAVKAWVSHMGVEAAAAACIGVTSAKAAKAAGWSDDRIFWPEKPGMPGWAQAVEEALAGVPQKV